MNHLESLETVIKCYEKTIRSNTGTSTILNKFNDFFEEDMSYIDSWLLNQLKNKTLKNNDLSTNYRNQGNAHFKQKNLLLSFRLYTKSLCFAIPSSKEYGLALANRSAVTLEMGKYNDALKDINHCLVTNYPVNLRPKILLRKAECLQHLTNQENFLEYLTEIQSYFEENHFGEENEKFIKKLNHFKNMQISQSIVMEESSLDKLKLPLLEKGENLDFTNSSAKVEMRYDSAKGRHVVAKEHISRGDVLFVEKAYSFGSIYDVELRNINQHKCYHCLNNVFSGIPCDSCVQCVFCNEECRDSSWNMYHKWECRGMQTDLWYHLGVAFPATRVLFKAGAEIFSANKSDLEEKTNRFGDAISNYKYIDSLTYHVRGDHVGTLVCSAAVVKYLADNTDFFTWLSSENSSPQMEPEEMLKFVGGILAKIILQLENNSSLIEHWVEENDSTFPTQRESIACGIFPSVSIMNHSCKPNISTYFIGDTIVVKALENIMEKSEILNCYGIDYRFMGRDERQNMCLALYNFECNCIVCSDIRNEMAFYDSIICQQCGRDVPDNETHKVNYCQYCKAKVDTQILRRAKDEVSFESTESALLECLHCRSKILSPKHSDLQDVYQKLYMLYIDNGDYDNFLNYFEKWLQNEKKRVGECAHKFAPLLHDIAQILLRRYSNRTLLNNNLIEVAKNLMKEAEKISFLYYPDYLIAKVRFE